MEVNILNDKLNKYEVGDLIKLESEGYAIIIEGLGNNYTLVNLDGQVITTFHLTIGELLESIHIIEHYKNKDLQIIRKE